MLISFTPTNQTAKIQIAPLWEGTLYFFADNKDNYPTDPSQVTQTNANGWNMEGDLNLLTAGISLRELQEAFTTNIPLISPPTSLC